jgi:ribonuclease HI
MIVLYVDGLCEPINPGGIMACGVVAYRGKQRILEASTAWASTPSSNNIAEYTACIHGLRLLSDMGLTSEGVVVCSDSQLMVRQINGEYAVHSENTVGLYYQVQQLAGLFHKIRFVWVPREQNAEADALSRRAYEAWIEEKLRSVSGALRYIHGIPKADCLLAQAEHHTSTLRLQARGVTADR